VIILTFILKKIGMLLFVVKWNVETKSKGKSKMNVYEYRRHIRSKAEVEKTSTV
jgi:hypothetical protein